jgi:hypothetical protein
MAQLRANMCVTSMDFTISFPRSWHLLISLFAYQGGSEQTGYCNENSQ